MAQAPHIPAWKRLGLKLKYAKEDAPESALASATNNGFRKTKANSANGITKSKSKSGHLDSRSSPSPTSNGSVPHINGHSDGPPPAKKQKRVSFSADTKLLDGDGNGASTGRSAIPSELTNASSFDATTGANSNRPPSPATATATATATAATPKPKPTRKSKTTPTPPSKHKSQNMLDYLHQYYNEHSSWKFQKNREVWILKHALSTEDIPTKDYGLALAQYVYGLKSEGARKRLSEEAEEKRLLTSTIETGEQESSTESQGEQLKRLREMLLSFPEKMTPLSDESHHYDAVLATLSRPLLILIALYPDSDGYTTVKNVETKTQPEPVSPLPKPSSAETSSNKKRKNRTTVVDYSSSSSSEISSESDSDGDTDSESGSDVRDGHDDSSQETTSESSSESDSS